MLPRRCVPESHMSVYFVCLRNNLECTYVFLTRGFWGMVLWHVLGNVPHRIFVFWLWCVLVPILVSVYDKWEWPRATYLVLTLCLCRGCVDGSQVKWYVLESLEVTSPSNSRKRTRHDQDGVQSYNKREEKNQTRIHWSCLVVLFLCKEKRTYLFIVIHVIVSSRPVISAMISAQYSEQHQSDIPKRLSPII